ncbi:sulfite reductase subunit alpha [Methyloferula stellata]|uniref:sulfite reductase subunit alpha n=1 Tax=Methyloferula stellata TaxID=876270 RepID=UPI00037E73C8|nr:sulfite reductase subunit alpha [Methyloferula stellata]
MSNPPTIPPLIPENAPFSEEQRAWLNGFFAGLLAPETLAVQEGQVPVLDANDGEAPWHDPAMPLEERMKLAEGKPLRRRMMAAMAQQDCGQCGYDCESYADAIINHKEGRLNLCVPGEKPTFRMVKLLAEEMNAEQPVAEALAVPLPAVTESSEPLPPGTYGRAAPATISFSSRRRLNKEDSEKATYHIEFDLTDSGLSYSVGDSLGVFPQNDPHLVDAVIKTIGAEPKVLIGGRTLRDILINDLSLGSPPDRFFEFISFMTGGERRQKAKLLSIGEDPDGDAATLDVLAALEKFPRLRPDPEAFIEALDPLQPRLYSISSSPKVNPKHLSLTVDHVRYVIGDRIRRGVASSWLGEALSPHTKLKAYIQKAHNFALPESNDVPIIMVGPGTGVAPFRAFLQERRAMKAGGGAWLFFGHQRRAADFFYEEEFSGMLKDGSLSKLSLAWSRDGDTKTYVQDKMRMESEDLYDWIARGAHFYVCGDAKRMAGDVERALAEIIAKHGDYTEISAKAFIVSMKKAGRYQTDVY